MLALVRIKRYLVRSPAPFGEGNPDRSAIAQFGKQSFSPLYLHVSELFSYFYSNKTNSAYFVYLATTLVAVPAEMLPSESEKRKMFLHSSRVFYRNIFICFV